MRDTQRKKVYDAEDNTFGASMRTEVFSFEVAAAVIQQMIEGEYYQSQKGYKRVKVKDGRGCRRAFYRCNDRSITLPRWARNIYVLCHELAHCLAHKTVDESAGHHASFCTHYLNLLYDWGKRDEAVILALEFQAKRVLFREKDLIFNLDYLGGDYRG